MRCLPSNTSPNKSPNKFVSGFSLIELMVAISLLSIVLIGGFAIFNTVQENYLREAASSNQLQEANAEADSLFIAFHDNTSFSARQWPADDPATTDNESLLSFTPIWGDTPWFDNTSRFACRLTSLDATAKSFAVNSACYQNLGLTESALNTALTQKTLPNVVLVGASHACIVVDIEAIGTTTNFIVLDSNCLSDAEANLLPVGDDGAGVILPRFLMAGQGKAEPISILFFDHIGGRPQGAGLAFGLNPEWQDNDSFSTASGSDNFTSTWVNIDDFNDSGLLGLSNPSGLTPLSLQVEVLDSALTGGALSLNSNGGDASGIKYFYNRSHDNMSASLQGLFINAPLATDSVDLRFTLKAGQMAWTRNLRLRLE